MLYDVTTPLSGTVCGDFVLTPQQCSTGCD